MKTTNQLLVVILLIITALATGYWWGSSAQLTPTTGTDKTAQTDRKILYYRNPMGLPDTSPIPKKDSMGMDYIPVYEDDEPFTESDAVHISTEKIQKLGVRTESAAYRTMSRKVQALATIQANERLLHTVTLKFEGWIQKLYVNTTGQSIKRGEVLMDVYSPELITAQHEYLTAAKGISWSRESDPEVQARMHRLAKNALQKLYNWDISEIDLHPLQHEGKALTYLPLRAAVNGIVIEKNVTQGKRFTPGEVLYEIADLSQVWVLAEVFEQDLRTVHLGQTATIKVDTYPDRLFSGKVTFIYPTVKPETRTTKIRIELTNEDALLKPEMYARVEFSSVHDAHEVLAIPNSAILNTGAQKRVLVALGAGQFEPRTVETGMQADDYTEVLSGLAAGDAVVTRANFLIDAESNLKAAFSGFNPSTSGPQPDEHNTTTKIQAKQHHAKGIIQSIDWTSQTLTIAHDPITSLGWPAMIMDFKVTESAVLQSLKPDQTMDFVLVENAPGEYVIKHLHPHTDNSRANRHDGHSGH
ncbi:MAG: efflux RND transporter periplasmic adaptor subunit [Burkholderiales bacterium]|nr:efflux RND transporter periplasmic adaptor subunit [Burkholderiales bacterium]MDR4516359.1 efflux RND transporter periplasmic adaptor subunit [Nitrosomonas sp.]